ncbi:MAG: HAD family phosphatase [Actinobacteria bacterium]|nr:HAD family phosphatase [Actinomycetota bacterium]
MSGALNWPAAALFDLDGTLIDREPLMAEAVARALAEAGAPLAADDRGVTVGRSWTDVYRLLRIEDRCGWSFDEFMSTVLAEADGLLAGGFEARVLDGGLELMELLERHGTKVAVVTGSLRREVGPALADAGMTDRVSLVLAAEDCNEGKPSPECYLLAARQLGADPVRCVVFEDSAVGVAAGLRAGMRVIASEDANAPEGDPARQDLSAAHVVVPTLRSVTERHVLVAT